MKTMLLGCFSDV